MTDSQLSIEKHKYKIADLKIIMTTYYKATLKRAIPYRTEEDFSEEESDGIIDLGQEFYEKIHLEKMQYSNCETIEYMYTGSYFNHLILKYGGCMLHSSAVVVDGYAYLFSADSGTGKSTHTKQWLEHFGENAYIINDDKPVIRLIDDELYVYGTPWSGKHDISKNIRVKLGGIVFLERSEKNWIEPLEVKKAVQLFFMQTVRKMSTEEKMDLMFRNMENVLTKSPIYKMGCNISEEAAIMAYEKIRRV